MKYTIGKLSAGCFKDLAATKVSVPDLGTAPWVTCNIIDLPAPWINDSNTITTTYPSTTTWIPSANTTLEGHLLGRLTSTDGETYIYDNFSSYAYAYEDVDYDEIIEIKDPDKEGIFVVGGLYKSCKDIPFIYFDVECEDLINSKTPVMCLGSELLPFGIPLYKEKIVDGIKYTKNMNRVWITKFLLKEKIMSYSWYENAEILSKRQNLIPFGSSNWFSLVQLPSNYKKNGKKRKSRKSTK